jgi:hypothetical protein
MSTVAPSFIWATGDSVMIHFPKKRCLSVSTTHTIQTRDRGAEKFGSLKDFEVRDVLEKEPRPNRSNSYHVDRAIDDSARSALTRNLKLDQRLAYDDLTQVIFYDENRC